MPSLLLSSQSLDIEEEKNGDRMKLSGPHVLSSSCPVQLNAYNFYTWAWTVSSFYYFFSSEYVQAQVIEI